MDGDRESRSLMARSRREIAALPQYIRACAAVNTADKTTLDCVSSA
jgi:hypothetical protein